MMENCTSSSYTITTTSECCKYRLPCGYCELKKKNCDYIIGVDPVKIDRDPYPFVSVYAAPAQPYPYNYVDSSIKVTPTTIICEDKENK